MCGIEPVAQRSGRRNLRDVRKTSYCSPHFRAYSGIWDGFSGLFDRNGVLGFRTRPTYYPTPDINVCITIND